MALDTVLSVLLAPLLLAQTAWTVRRAERLPEPEGERVGTVGDGPHLRFLQIGDSSCVGVGVARQELALAPRLAAHLGDDFRVTWTLCGENGATTADALRLLDPVKDAQFDAAYVIFGVNDAKNLRPAHHWRRDYRALIETLRARHKVRVVFVSGLPPVGEFPLIPHPLRYVLALRTRRFDRALRRVVRHIPDCHHLPISARLDPAGMASDGFHPGEGMYAEWALQASMAMRPLLGVLEVPRQHQPQHETHGNHDQVERQSAREG